MVKTNQKQKILIILVVILLVGVIASNKSIPKNTQLQTNIIQTKTFQSKIMKFTIGLPSNYQGQEKLGSVTVSTPKGILYIDRNGTNFDNIEDYVQDLGKKNKFILSNKKNLQINSLEAIVGNTNREKLYFIYSNYAVYTLSAKEEPLFPDLDQIAQSFRYTP